MKNKGFLLLQNVIAFSLGSLLLLGTLRICSECFLTMQKKLLLENAISVAEITLYHTKPLSDFLVLEQEAPTNVADLDIKEIIIHYNDKIIFSLATAK